MSADHYPHQPSDWGDFDTPVSGCVPCGVPANAEGKTCTSAQTPDEYTPTTSDVRP